MVVLRKTLKKIAALGTGVAMIGATITGAMALDLASYPSPFVVGGAYDDSNAFVVGDNAAAADTLGAVDIATSLQYESKVAVTEEGSSLTVTGGKSEQIPLGFGLANSSASLFDTSIEDDDVSTLWDGTITFNGKEYDTSEALIFESGGPSMQTSLTASDDDYKSNVFMEVLNRGQIRFAYKFDESIGLRGATTSIPLTINFLGDRFEIVSVTDAGTSFTARVGDQNYINVGETIEVEIGGVKKVVTLTDVGSSSVIVDVDGTTESISNGGTETVNGVEITVDDVLSRTTKAESSAILIVGLQSTETYTDGDAYLGESTDDPDWVWDIASLQVNGTTQNITIINDFVMNDDQDNPPGVGECLSLPGEYVQICFDSLSVADADYASYVLEYESSTDLSNVFSTNTSVPALYFHTATPEGFELLAASYGAGHFQNETTDKRAKEIWLHTPSVGSALDNGSSVVNVTNGKWGAVYYKDTSDAKVKLFGYVNLTGPNFEIARINYGNTKGTNAVLTTEGMNAAATEVNLTLDIAGDSTTILNDGQDDIGMVWGLTAVNSTFLRLGATAATEELRELTWGGVTNAVLQIGTKDEDHRTYYGIIIRNPKSNGASDEVELGIPQDQVKANVVIKGTASSVSSGSTTYQPTKVTPVTKLASEVSTASAYNLILVGGPCANALVEELFDMTCDGWSFQEGEAVVKLAENGDKVALLIAGTTADDTRRAAKALASYADYALSGTEALVTGTSLTDITVGAVPEAAAEEVVVADETAAA